MKKKYKKWRWQRQQQQRQTNRLFSWIPLTLFDHANHIDIDHKSASIFGIDHFSIGFFDVMYTNKRTKMYTRLSLSVTVTVTVLIWHINYYCYANECDCQWSVCMCVLSPSLALEETDLIKLNHNDVHQCIVCILVSFFLFSLITKTHSQRNCCIFFLYSKSQILWPRTKQDLSWSFFLSHSFSYLH